MKKAVCFFSIASALSFLTPAMRAADSKPKASGDEVITFTVDVAMDASGTRASRADWSLAGTVRGDSIVSSGIVYNGGSIPEGDTTATFAVTDEGRLGTIVSRAQFIADASELASGAALHSVASTHIFRLDEGSGVVTEGLEGTGPEVRAVLGGYGWYAGAAGLNLRYTFTLKLANMQESSEFTRRKALNHRR
jgi:hypothetical protein